MPTKNQRLVSIDLLRGLTVMLMIFVNNGAGDSIFSTLQHSKWNGMTLADCVFPSFLFIMGMSTYLSLKKYNFEWSGVVAKKIIKRGALLFLIGLGINWLDMAFDGRPLDFEHLRVWGVMQRLGICYLLTAAMALTWRRGFIPIIIIGLVAYSALLLLGDGYSYDASTNILSRVDNAVVGWNHLYHKSPVDPEGLVSTFSATLHTMIGFVVMEYLNASLKNKEDRIKNKEDGIKNKAQITFLAVLSITFLLIGFILTSWLPLNKRVWSPSYVLVSIGITSAVLALLIALIDGRGGGTDYNQYPILKSFGMNPLVLYVGSEAVAIIFGALGIKEIAYNGIHTIISNASWAGFTYALLFTALFALIGLYMYKKRIFIKL